jgi:prephenate dehydrogenase
MSIKNKSIAIVGLGLMGGSLALALRKRYPALSLYGVTRNRQTLRHAKRKKVISDGYTSIRALYAEHVPDMIVLATPVQVIKQNLKDICEYATNVPIVTDLGSTKAEISTLVEKEMSRFIHFIGSHPMTGSHNAGYAYADPELYTNAICFVTKSSATHIPALRTVMSLWKTLKSKVVEIDPKSHDAIVARISHLPHAVAFALVDTVARYGDEGFMYAGGGFRDFTRIAGSDPKMWLDIFATNKKNILSDLKAFRSSIDRLITMVEKSNSAKLFDYFKRISNCRRNIQRN